MDLSFTLKRLFAFTFLASTVFCVVPSSLIDRGIAMDRDSLIEGYFHLGINYTEILAFLVLCHGICLSMRQLKRILRERGLTRRSRLSPVNEIVDVIESELQGSGRLLGYRLMHKRIGLSHSLVVDRETVRAVMKALDPEGVERRSQHRLVRRNYHAKRPNFIWHIDGYDKLKPFEFCIHGAIDGYSRCIMWLEVDHSNNNPCTIAKYFLNCVCRVGGTATVVRGDCGTENCYVAAFQRFFREGQGDTFAGDISFMYGRSVSNQRIEAWWSMLRKMETDFWINYFKDLREVGLYCDDDILHVQCLKFCYMPLLKEELYRVVELWNLHRIRPQSSNEHSPPGRPEVLYFLPELNGKVRHIHNVTLDDIELAEHVCDGQTGMDDSFQVFEELASIIMGDEGLNPPRNPDEALQLYIDLLGYIEDIM